MTLELVEYLSLPGDPAKANEDAFAEGTNAAVVLDGAAPGEVERQSGGGRFGEGT